MNSDRTYYGGFFWVAAVSFIVPLFVAVSAFRDLQPAYRPEPDPDVSGVDNKLFDHLLRLYVDNGQVDYEGLSRDYLFSEYLRELASATPENLQTDEERLALLCNAYNAFVINGVITHRIHRNERNVLSYTPEDAAQKIEDLQDQLDGAKQQTAPDSTIIKELTNRINSIRQESGFFDLAEHVFAGETVSLNHLEHEVIRPTFEEPRVHMALVCAARSCPSIRAEAYVGDRLELQLDDQARLFANNEDYVRYSDADGTIYLSPILDWYEEDWHSAGGYLEWLSERVTSDELREKLLAAERAEIPVVFSKYDWSLNSQAGGTSTSGGAAGFGSGSVPNE